MSSATDQSVSNAYLPATDVGRQFGYTKDYILMLIKQGKIDGKKIKNKWHADPQSAETFFEEAKRERVERRRKLSIARKAELRAKQLSKNSLSQKESKEKTVATKIESIKREMAIQTPRAVAPPTRADETTLALNRTPSQALALAQTFLVALLGTTLGFLGYFGTEGSEYAGHNFPERVALHVYDTLFPSADWTALAILGAGEGEENTLEPKEYTDTKSSALSMNVGTTTHTSIMLSDTEVYTATTVETVEDSIRQSFSDDVEVVVDEDDEGVVLVTPQFIDGEGETHRFKIVPADDYEANISNE